MGQQQGDNGSEGQSGFGGVNRGRGDAELIWGDESPDLLERMKSEMLPAAEVLDPSSLWLGEVEQAPGVDPRPSSGVGTTAGAAVRGEATWTRRLRPKHRDAVRGFFGRSDTSKSKESKSD